MSVRVGLLGCGEVGSAVARELLDHDDFEIAGVAVRHPDKVRPVPLDPRLYTTDALEVALDTSVDIVVEVIGGISPTIDYISAALLSGKPVVTANKELLASPCSSQIFDIAHDYGVPFFYEAAVGGGIPIVRVLKESLRGDRVRMVSGVINGTTNYVLDRWSEGISFEQALDEARAAGFAEADARADLSGRDSAAKIALLASIAFSRRFTIDDVDYTGIEAVTTSDLTLATARGETIKLVATAERAGDDISLSVHPRPLPGDHPFAGLGSVTNAIVIEADLAGTLTFSGMGAGGRPTAAAVMGDVASAVV